MKVFEKFRDKVVRYHQGLRKKRIARMANSSDDFQPVWRGCAASRGWIVMETIDGVETPRISIDKMAYDYNELLEKINKMNDRNCQILNRIQTVFTVNRRKR